MFKVEVEGFRRLSFNARAQLHYLHQSAIAWAHMKAVDGTAAFFDWALSQRKVQAVIARRVQQHGILCAAVSDAVDAQSFEVDADNVVGLERYIEGAVERGMNDLELHAENIKDLDVEIRECISRDLRDGDFTDDLADAIGEVLAERMMKRRR